MAMPNHIDDDDLLPKVPAVITIDRKEIFGRAASRLSLSVLNERTLDMDSSTFLSVIEIDNVPTRSSLTRHRKQFYGEFATTEHAALQSAYHAALKYLEKEKFIVVDDYNHEHVVRLEKQYFCSTSWAMLFEETSDSLRAAIRKKNAALYELLSSVQHICEDHSAIAPMLPAPQASLQLHAEQPDGVPTRGVAASLIELRDRLLQLTQEAAKEKWPLPLAIQPSHKQLPKPMRDQ